MRKFKSMELARLKRTAKNVDQFIGQKNKLVAKIEELQKELAEVNRMIEITDAPTREMTGGFGSEDIIRKVITNTGVVNKNGVEIKKTTFEFIYDTIIPEAEDTMDTKAIGITPYSEEDIVEDLVEQEF